MFHSFKASFQTGAFMTGLHDARAGSSNDHPSFASDFAGEIDRLQIFRFGRQRSRGPEHRHFAHMRMRREHFVGVTQLPNGGLDDADVAARLDILEKLEAILDDVSDKVFVKTAAFVGD